MTDYEAFLAQHQADIEAMELKIKGYSGVDIARLYHTKPTHVGAWISRASEKLREDVMNAEKYENTA